MKNVKVQDHSADRASSRPLYQQVKSLILEKIDTGEWRQGMKVHSEAELVASTGFSRMTVNRALRELTAEGRLVRRQGKGTFVAERKPQSALLEIHSIADEIKARSGSHSCDVHFLGEEKAPPDIAAKMEMEPYAPLFRSILVHKDGGVPLQVGSRYINPEFAPDYLEQDFTRQTPNEYLLGLAQVSAVEHVVEALIPDIWIRELLQINSAEPCLALYRRTWVGELVATYSTFIYPGSRYTLGSTFSVDSSGLIQTR